MRRHPSAFALGLLLCLLAPLAAAFDTSARQAVLVDLSTGTVLLEKNADERMPTSSMSKLMTMYLVFSALKEGRIGLDDTFTVSEKAWQMGGSKMFVRVGTAVPIGDLIQGVTVQSGNDATIVLAEGLAGSEAAFADRMNRVARDLGMTGSNFRNASGWPDPDHYSTARDLALLATRLIQDFPEYYHYFSQRQFTYGKSLDGKDITQRNRNPLLQRGVPGVDGLKTGHTAAAGYGLTASAERDGRRIVLVVNGLESEQQRAEETERLIEWAFRDFSTYPLFEAGAVVETAPVWLGRQEAVDLVLNEPVTMTLSRPAREGLKVTAVIEGPVPAPVAAGDQLATLVIEAPGVGTRRLPLYAAHDVAPMGTVERMGRAAQELLFGASAADP